MNSIRQLLRGLPSLAPPLPAFDVSRASPTPAAQFTDWLHHAIDAGVREPHAMTLSTVDPDGVPDARVLILKDLTDDTWWFATSSASPKGRHLTATPRAALTFYWPELGRQIRVRGPVITADPATSAQDFRERGASARAMAATGRQSTPKTAAPVPRDAPTDYPEWTVYGVAAGEAEFWQGDPDRDHTRLRYTATGGGWEKTQLCP
ncbi:pyridoxine/pyridoxamine 5'-phosphate oxidase [Kibdelosporangium phytohabitans]|nr:pyridoxal 5'-phosphate synthase [Kibdelosporangium phytohabitans]